MPVNRILSIIATSRPAFLILTPCCLSLAIAFAITGRAGIIYPHLVLIFIAALASHISVNMFNEYEDFRSGLDFHTQRTAFSGGSGTLPSLPELAESVHGGAVASLLLTIAIGIYFMAVVGLGLLPIGLLGVLCIYFYTTKITHRPLLCLIVPGLAFGPLMINGAYYVLTGNYNVKVVSASLIVFFLVNNLLLLNQFPDQEADKSVGRLHLPILIGRKKSAWVYVSGLAAAYAILLLNIVMGFLPVYSAIGLLSVFAAIPAARIVLRYFDEMENLQPALALNVAVTLTTPVLIAFGMLLQHYAYG